MFYDHFLNLLEGLEYKYNPKTVRADLELQQQVLGMVFDKLQDIGVDDKLLNSAKRTLENNIE
jgi:hypothetical protein